MFRLEGTGGVLGRVKAGTMKAERLARTMVMRRILRCMLGCEPCDYELLYWQLHALRTEDAGRKMTAGYSTA